MREFLRLSGIRCGLSGFSLLFLRIPVLELFRLIIRPGYLRLEPSERPVVEEDQDEGEGNEHGFGHEPQGKEPEGEEIFFCIRFFHVEGVSSHGEHPEEGGEDVLSFRHPGHGLHMEGMEGEEGGHEGAWPEGAGHPVEDQEQQDRIDDVKEDIDQMVPSGFQPEELNVQHVGKPGQRVPVAGMGGGEGPGDALETQPRPNMRILGHIIYVIVVDKIIIRNLPVNRENYSDEKQTNDPFAADGRCFHKKP